MHGRYDATTGKRVAKELEPFKLLWLEEPVPAENIDAMRDMRASTQHSDCCGENFYLRMGISRDSRKAGGRYHHARHPKDAAVCWRRARSPIWRTPITCRWRRTRTSPIGMMATAHVCAAIPNFLVTEWHWIDSLDLWRNWVKEGEIIQKGFITVPDGPVSGSR